MERTKCETCVNLGYLAKALYQHIVNGECNSITSSPRINGDCHKITSSVINGSMEVKISNVNPNEDLRQVVVANNGQGKGNNQQPQQKGEGSNQQQRNNETSDERIVTKATEQKPPLSNIPTFKDLERQFSSDTPDILVCDSEEIQLLADQEVDEFINSNIGVKKTEVERATPLTAAPSNEPTSDYFSDRPRTPNPAVDSERPRSIVRRVDSDKPSHSRPKSKENRKRKLFPRKTPEPGAMKVKQRDVRDFIINAGSSGHLKRVMYRQTVSSRMEHHLDMVKENRKSPQKWKEENVHAYFLNNEDWANQVQNYVRDFFDRISGEQGQRVSATRRMDMITDVLYPESILFALMHFGKYTMEEAEREYKTPVPIREENDPFGHLKERRTKHQ